MRLTCRPRKSSFIVGSVILLLTHLAAYSITASSPANQMKQKEATPSLPAPIYRPSDHRPEGQWVPDDPEPIHNYVPPDGVVPSRETAVRIAEAIWEPIYGEKNITRQRPMRVTLTNGIWTVRGSLPPGHCGGVALAEIRKLDGCVLRISHGR